MLKSKYLNPAAGLLAMTLLMTSLGFTSMAVAQIETTCAFSNDLKPSLHVDPWAKTQDKKVQRFGATENGDESYIQNCRGVDGKYIALSLGTIEAAQTNESANTLYREDLGEDRCEVAGPFAAEYKSSVANREALKLSRLRTLRTCVAVEVMGIGGQNVVVGHHPTCQWTNAGPNRFIGRGATCTVKIARGFGISVRPVVDPSCLNPETFTSGQAKSGDLETMLQAVLAENEIAEAVSETIGVAKRRIVFSPPPAQIPFDNEAKMRFPKTFGYTVAPVNAEILTERARDASTSYISMSWFVQNMGQWHSSYLVPLAAEAELIESVPNGRPRTVMNWLAYSTGHTLAPADWSGLFNVNRREITDFAFKHGRRYRIRLKFLHPHDVPSLIKSDMEQTVPLFESSPASFQTQLFPGFNEFRRIPAFGLMPRLGSGPNEVINDARMSNVDKEILNFFRSLGVDDEFPARYTRGCLDGKCAGTTNVSYVGEANFDFTADAVPGAVGTFKVKNVKSTSKMIYQQQSVSYEHETGSEVKCP